MKRLSLLLIALPVLVLGACASSPDREEIERELRAVYNPFDMEYVHQVNQNASRAGARVIWVNPPRKSDRDN